MDDPSKPLLGHADSPNLQGREDRPPPLVPLNRTLAAVSKIAQGANGSMLKPHQYWALNYPCRFSTLHRSYHRPIPHLALLQHPPTSPPPLSRPSTLFITLPHRRIPRSPSRAVSRRPSSSPSLLPHTVTPIQRRHKKGPV